jgi:PAS domain S-box-containing protein
VPQAGATGEEVAQALLAAIIASSNDAIASKTLDGIVTSWNSGAERLFGYTAEEMMGRPIAILGAPGREAEMPMILERIRRGERIQHFDTVRRRKDGTLVEISLTVSPVRDSTGRIVGASKIARDISERRAAEERQRLLVAELDHRVKNTLAVVHSLAARSLGTSPERQTLLGRLQALTNAHELLSAGKWRAGNLAGLVQAELAAHLGQVEVKGADLPLTARATLTLALVLHELAANAAQHGALSVPEGRVELAWRIGGNGSGPRFHLTWAEQGGPAAGSSRPTGFGLALIERAPRHDLQAEVRLTFGQTGLVYTLAAPLGTIAASA